MTKNTKKKKTKEKQIKILKISKILPALSKKLLHKKVFEIYF